MNENSDDLDDGLKHNPWSVENVDQFLFYNCPECDNKTQSKSVFINHAYLNHPRARQVLPQIDEDLGTAEEYIPPSLSTENFEILKEPKTELLEVSEEDAADLFNLALDQEEVENHEEEYIDQRLESVS